MNVVRKRLEEIQALYTDKTGKLFEAAESGELIDHCAWLLFRLAEQAREIEQLRESYLYQSKRAVAAEADRDRWKARAKRLAKMACHWLDSTQLARTGLFGYGDKVDYVHGKNGREEIRAALEDEG